MLLPRAISRCRQLTLLSTSLWSQRAKPYHGKPKDVTITTIEISHSSASVAGPNLERHRTTDGLDPTIVDDEITKLSQIYDPYRHQPHRRLVCLHPAGGYASYLR